MRKPKTKRRPASNTKALAPMSRKMVLPGTVTATAWMLPKGLTFHEWLKCGVMLADASAKITWLIADWWAYGEHAYGERTKLVTEGMFGDLKFQTLMDYGWVARAVEARFRNEALSFSHHKAIAPLPPAEQRLWLDWAVRESASAAELRAKIGRRKPMTALLDDVQRIDGDGHDHDGLPPPTAEALRNRLDTGIKLISDVASRSPEMFLGIRATPERLRALARFLENVADAIDDKTNGSEAAVPVDVENPIRP